MNCNTWLEVFKYLDLKTIGQIRSVCKNWNRILFKNRIWYEKAKDYNLVNNKNNHFNWYQILKELKDSSKIITKDKFKQWIGENDDDITFMIYRNTKKIHDLLLKFKYNGKFYHLYLRYQIIINQYIYQYQSGDNTDKACTIMILEPFNNPLSYIGQYFTSTKLINVGRQLFLNDPIEDWEKISSNKYMYFNCKEKGGLSCNSLKNTDKDEDHLLNFNQFQLAKDVLFLKIILALEKYYYYYFLIDDSEMHESLPYQINSKPNNILKLIQVLNLHSYDSNISLFENAKNYYSKLNYKL